MELSDDIQKMKIQLFSLCMAVLVRKNNLLDAIFVQEKSHQNETGHANRGKLHAECTQLENIFTLR